ncbi:MAG: CotH kinase family protein [Saprospiraceae bacterium]|nr:CotH kinase family protein [Saprospiraceae bacterium]
MRLFSTLTMILVILTSISSQNLPSQWHKTDDGKYLVAGDQMSSGFYDESTVEEIRIYFSQSNYWALMTQNYNAKIDIPCQVKYKDAVLDSVGIRFKGQTSYFMNNTQKKSFNLSIDAYKDQKIGGYKTLNLNNAWQDPSFMREVLYYQLIRKHTPAAKANFVRLYINDQDWGIYLNVQQLNKDFLEEWYESNNGINLRADTPDGTASSGGGGPGGGGAQWGDGTAAFNYLGTDTAQYQKYYTLKSNDSDANPWNELMEACKVLNNSGAALESEAPKVFNIDNILWHLAAEIAFVDDDSYVYKGKMDYYLYKDAETNRWQTYDYDGNSAIATNRVSWSAFYNEAKTNYPLLNKLLAVPAFRQRYLAHLRTILTDLFDETKVNALIDKNDALIRAGVFADAKKATTNAAYTSEISVLKNFIKNRKANLLANAEVKVVGPIINDTKYQVNGADFGVVRAGDRIVVSTNVSFASGLQQVVLHYCAGFSGVFTPLTMKDDGQNGDVQAGDGIFTADLPEFSAGTLVRFYVEEVGNNGANTRTYFPAGAEHHLMIFSVESKVNSNKTVVLNEFMASNNGIIKDEAGENEDWIELYNTTSTDIDISGFFITDNPDNLEKFVIPEGTIIKANEYLIIWADEDQEQGPLHANFKLSAGGEPIILLDKQLSILDSVIYDQQVANKSAARIPNGVGAFVIGDHTFGKNNEEISSTINGYNNHLKVFPNPSSGYVTVANEKNETVDLMIYSISGLQLSAHRIDAGAQIIIDHLLPGLYLLSGEGIKQKLIISGQ